MLNQTPEARAAIVANNIYQLANNVAKQHASFKKGGINAQGSQPAVTSAQYLTALGGNNVAILDAILAANPQS